MLPMPIPVMNRRTENWMSDCAKAEAVPAKQKSVPIATRQVRRPYLFPYAWIHGGGDMRDWVS